MEWLDLWQLLELKTLMLGHGGSSAGSYLADPTSPIPLHCAVIILFQSVPVHQLSLTGTVRVKRSEGTHAWRSSLKPQSLQATVCCQVGAAALVHLRPGGPGLPNKGFNSLLFIICALSVHFSTTTIKWLQQIKVILMYVSCRVCVTQGV